MCPCFAAARECDPDLCKRCTPTALSAWRRSAGGASAQQLPATAGDCCENMKVQLKQHKRVLLGLSGVSGWGAFLRDGARKNQLIGEYTGELVTQARPAAHAAAGVAPA